MIVMVDVNVLFEHPLEYVPASVVSNDTMETKDISVLVVNADVVIVPVVPKNLAVLVVVPSKYVKIERCPADTFVIDTVGELVVPEQIVVDPLMVATGISCTVTVIVFDVASAHVKFLLTTRYIVVVVRLV